MCRFSGGPPDHLLGNNRVRTRPSGPGRLDVDPTPRIASSRDGVHQHALRRFLCRSLPGYLLLVFLHSRTPWLHGASVRQDSDPMPYGLILLQVAILLYLFLAYLATARCLSRAGTWQPGLQRNLALLCVVAALAVPVNSSDVFAYIGFGRMLALHAVNPYLHSYREFTDSYSNLAWFDGSMPYGPTFLPVATIAGVVLFLKALWGLCLWASVRCMRKAGVGTRDRFLFAANPLVLLELLCNAHNDALVVLFLAGAACFVLERRLLLALLCGTLAALTKLPLAVVLAPVVVLAVRSKAWRLLAGAAVLLVPFVAVFFSGALGEPSLFINPSGTTSTASLQVQILKFTSSPTQETGVRLSFLALYALFCVWRLRHITHPRSAVREMAVLVVGMLLVSTQFQPWYVTWLLVLAVFTSSRWLLVLAVSASVSVLSFYGLRYADITHATFLRVLRVLLFYGLPAGIPLVSSVAARRRSIVPP